MEGRHRLFVNGQRVFTRGELMREEIRNAAGEVHPVNRPRIAIRCPVGMWRATGDQNRMIGLKDTALTANVVEAGAFHAEDEDMFAGASVALTVVKSGFGVPPDIGGRQRLNEWMVGEARQNVPRHDVQELILEPFTDSDLCH